MKARILIGALLLTVTACSTGDASGEMTATLDEWSIDLSTDRYEPGAVSIAVDNVGEFPHTLVVEAADGNVVAATDVIVPGQSAVLEIELGNDSYRFTCRIVGSDETGAVVDHFEEGMVASASAS